MRFVDDPSWAALVGALEQSVTVDDRDPYGLVVTAGRSGPTPTAIEIVMTPGEWRDLVGIAWGAVRPAAQHVRQLVLRQPPDHRYLVYSQYELVPCRTAEIPPDPEHLRMQELAARYPGGVIPGGYWSAHPPDADPPE